ncbi:transmembrane prolyl 4-hydroxylase-like [Asterias rubens]|uniref:transmembrane prolyl 4-hydroxylase-like n=1 Tax=Asterias rubens TaxID=7604 RepID=UPI001454E460|nr:transmembrane prolyl 4-hydroxylase-like [Asterias rubens]
MFDGVSEAITRGREVTLPRWTLQDAPVTVLVFCAVLLCQLAQEGASFDAGDTVTENLYRGQDGEDKVKAVDSCKLSGLGDCGKEQRLEERLVRLEGERVGHVEELELIPGKKHLLRTISMKPVIFEIPDFFTSEECKHMIALAKEQGLEESKTTSSGTHEALPLYDGNRDNKLSLKEMQQTLEDGFDVYLDDGDVRQMYSDLGIDLNHDDFLSRQEVTSKSIGLIKAYVSKLKEEMPSKKSRFSEQTWIYPDKTTDPLVLSFQERISRLTRLPQALIDKFSYFQVVHYGKHGHYNAHHDSSNVDSMTCCHLTQSKRCRICRFMTIMVYLNTVEQGGETAFPIANNDTYDRHVFRLNGMMNLNARCHQSNLRVQPQLGKAVIWYNHFINETTGWLGDVDPFTWHGGCPVTKGKKWIMNRWIAVSNDRELDLELS